MLPENSRGWDGLQVLRSQLSTRLTGFVRDRSLSRPSPLENQSHFFEDDLRCIIAAEPIVYELSEDKYKEMDMMALDLLDELNAIVNKELLNSPEVQNSPQLNLPEHSPQDLLGIRSLAGSHKHLSALLHFLQAQPKDKFSLASGPGTTLFVFPQGGRGMKVKGHAKSCRAFLDHLAAKAEIAQGSETLTLQALGLPVEETMGDQSNVLETCAGMMVDAVFKEFRQLNCANLGTNRRTHEIRLRLSTLYAVTAQTALDLFVSCCPAEASDEWHEEAEKQSLCIAIHQAKTESKKLHLLVHQQELFDVTNKVPAISSSPANFRAEALSDLFERRIFSHISYSDYISGAAEGKVGYKEKAEIALLLSRCLLDFFDDDIELASHSWVPEQIFFISPVSTNITSKDDIYISLRPRPCKKESIDLLGEFGAGNPILLSFARLLMGIEAGEEIPISVDSEAIENLRSWASLCELVQMKKEKGENAPYMDAVQGCLHLCSNPPAPKDRATGSAARKVLRKAIHEKIIRNLERITNPDSTKRKRTTSISDYPQAKKVSVADRSRGKPLEHAEISTASQRCEQASPSSKSCFHQNEKEKEPITITVQMTQQAVGMFDGCLHEAQKGSSKLPQPTTFKDLNKTWDSRFEFKEKDSIVKIAILDTGIDVHHKDFQKARAYEFREGEPVPARGEISQLQRMRLKKNFCNDNEDDIQDLDGHGTQVASIILRLAPRAELCIARICVGETERGLSEDDRPAKSQENHLLYPRSDIVVKAIRWAIQEKVNIINMSFGFAIPNCEVDAALKEARKQGILIFAAMANEGRHRKAAWPARELRDAIGIHSCEDLGKRSSRFTPMPIKLNPNFMVAGEGLVAHWLTAKGGAFRAVDGTSFATPVAVAMAALILAFANQMRGQYEMIREKHSKTVGELRMLLSKNSGMRKVLEAISEESQDGYLWISPKLLWANFPGDAYDGSTNEEVIKHGWMVISDALRK